MRTTHESACPDIGPICAERDEPPQIHDQRFAIGELRASAEHAFTDALGVELQVPLRLNRTTIQFRRLDGTPVTLDYENIHHRDETLFGLGDPWVQARHAFLLGQVRLTTRAGFTVPLGNTVEDPFALGAAGQPHQHVQFGTGTVQPLLALEAERAWDSWSARLWGQAWLSVAENSRGFRAGHRFSLGLSGSLNVAGTLWASAGADMANEQPERWGGIVQQDGNLGRTDVLVGGGLHWSTGATQLGLTLRIPVYSHIIGHHGQLEYPGLLNLSVGTTFGE
ncbi:hypothetical protein [Hyalangium gracile]|uniref:hypothetical protein n=1 Tax=Hyalangium gracile TaxID=394092 RepID=UPI001CD00693|nr:hypothetical protein [Hyalangium gracile]